MPILSLFNLLFAVILHALCFEYFKIFFLSSSIWYHRKIFAWNSLQICLIEIKTVYAKQYLWIKKEKVISFL